MKYKFILVLTVSWLFVFAASAMPNADSLLLKLNQTLENQEKYYQEKKDKIESLRNDLEEEKNLSLQERFNLYNRLYNEYQSFKYDSAFAYALKLRTAANKLGDSVSITHSKLKLTFTLLSSGMFKETLDSLAHIDIRQLPDSIKIDYYAQYARAYYDLASYNQDIYYSDRYTARGNAYLDSAIALSQPNSYRFYSLRGLKHYKERKFERAKSDFKQLLNNFSLTDHQYAIAAASLALSYRETEDFDRAIEWMTRAAISDIKAAAREAVALMLLAELLYTNGDESTAYRYIKQALEDAEFYGARQRQIQVSAILPIIEGDRLATVESQRTHLAIYAVVVTLLSALVIIFAIIIFRQLKQLRKAKKTVTEANSKLQELNERLMEANAIKEEYIGHSFNMYSDYLEKIEKFKRSVDNKLMARKFDEISHVMKTVNLKKEREALYLSFDKIFIKLFPNFVPVFNSYFRDEDKIVLKDDQSLNIELRIFALIRIGIHDHEQIARILEYSVSTIYNYKTKVRNRSILPNDQFEKRIMEIKAF